MENINEVQQAFLDLKQQKQVIEDAELQRVYENAQVFANKYAETGQTEALKKLVFVLQTVTKERELLKLGFNQFIYKDAIDAYIDQVSVKPIKITELCNYVRDIPQEIVDKVKLTKEIFDEFFVVYTDYTSKEDRRVEAAKRERDPILFGVFLDRNAHVCNERFYYIGDWIDEYCDLTFDRMLTDLGKYNVKPGSIETPKTIDELKSLINTPSFSSLSLSVPLTSNVTTQRHEEAKPKELTLMQKIRKFLGV